MKLVRAWQNCVIGILAGSGLMCTLILGPTDLTDIMDDCFLEDHAFQSGKDTFPKEIGIYMATVEEWLEHVPDYEPEWELRLSNVRKVDGLVIGNTIYHI